METVKKLIALVLALVLIGAVVFFVFFNNKGGEKDLLARVKERGTLVIATEGNWSPWTYHDESGALTGFDIEIGTLIAESIGVKPDFRETEWSSILAGVDTGVFDIACNGVGYTETRAEKYDFSTPYVYTEVVLVVRGDNDSIHTLEDLNGKVTSNSPNSTYATLAESKGASVVYVDTLGETLSMILQGRADATLNAKGSIEDYLSEHPDANIKIVYSAPGEPVCYPVRKNADSASLLAAVNAALEKARQDGTLAALSTKYFGADLTHPM